MASRINFRDGNKIASSGSSGFYQYVGGVWSQLGGSSDSHTGDALGSWIGGGSGNTVDSGANYGVIVAGVGNTVDDDYSFIGAGLNNWAGGFASVVVGGSHNSGEGSRCFIGAGYSGVIANTSLYAFIGAGYTNSIYGDSYYSSIIGGYVNLINDQSSAVICGGENNSIIGVLSYGGFIGGGDSNKIYSSGVFSGNSSILGGYANTGSGNYFTILGGTGNKISNFSDFAIAAGRRASVTSSGAAVFADGQNRIHPSKGEHTMSLDYASGVYLTLPRFTGASSQTGNYGETKVSGAYLYVCTGISGSGWGRVELLTF